MNIPINKDYKKRAYSLFMIQCFHRGKGGANEKITYAHTYSLHTISPHSL